MHPFRTTQQNLLKRAILGNVSTATAAASTSTHHHHQLLLVSALLSSTIAHSSSTSHDEGHTIKHTFDSDENNNNDFEEQQQENNDKNNNNKNNNGLRKAATWEAGVKPITVSFDAATEIKTSAQNNNNNNISSDDSSLSLEEMMMGGAGASSSQFSGSNDNNNSNNMTNLEDTQIFQQHNQNTSSSSSSPNVIEEEDQGLIFAAELLCDDLLNCKTDVLRQFARSRGAKSVSRTSMVSELVEIASKTVSNPAQRSIARRILGSDVDLPKNEGVRSAWTNESLEASMLENAASRKAKFAQTNFGANLRATSVRVSPISQRLLRAVQDDFTSVSHAAVKGVHREYVETAKQILQQHELNLPSLVAVFSTMLAYRIESSEIQEFISSANIQARAVFLGLNRPSVEGGENAAAASSSSSPSAGNSSVSENNNNNNNADPAAGSDIVLPSSSPSPSSPSAHPTSTLDHLMSMLDDVVAEVQMRQQEFVDSPRFTGTENKKTFRYSLASFKQRQMTMKRDAVAVRRALADVPQWVIEMARQFEVWETLVRSDIEDLRRAPAEIFDLILVNVAASAACSKLHDDSNFFDAASGNGDLGNNSNGGKDDMFGSSSSSSRNNRSSGFTLDPLGGNSSSLGGGGSNPLQQNTVPGYYRQALRDAIDDFADEGASDTIVLRLNAYAAGKTAFAVNRPVLRQNLFSSIHVMMHGMVTDDVTDPPFERVVMILQEFTKTIHRSERIGSLFQTLVQLTEAMHFHLRFAAVFPQLSENDKQTVRQGNRSLQLPLINFEQQQQVAPLPVSGVAFFCIVMMYFCVRAPNTVAATLPIATRLESCTGIDELAIVTLSSLKAHTIRGLQVSHPPRMTYTSWIDSENNTASNNNNNNNTNSSGMASIDGGNNNNSNNISASSSSSSSSSSVYKLLPSDAVKSSTSNLMLTSRAPIIRSLDAISKVPWRINKMMLHVQEAILQEGYAFGKIRASFYPLSYARMQTGEITIGSPFAPSSSSSSSPSSLTSPINNNNNNNSAESKSPNKIPSSSSTSAPDDSNNNNNNSNNNNNNNNNKRKLFSHRLYRKYAEEQNKNWRELLDTRSPRVHHIQALRQARALVNVARVYFPNNMDFRGRMYPMPGRLNHTGSDPFRASLEFADPKPLGPDGLYWLKVHLANKMGQTKLSFADRVRWVDEHISDVVQSAEAPLSGDRWWQEGDEPFQALNACKELADALSHSTGPENFLSRLPVAVDGSYNGLQHYSAIGRDEAGGALVNLVPQKLPSDAYTGILKEMMKEILSDAAKDHAVAQRCIGSGRGMDKNHVRRKTIKQSIMTQVYGVTEYGMAEQIKTQLVNQNKAHGLWTNAEITEMSAYLRDKVNESLGVTFRQTQECRSWLAEVSALIWKCQPSELRNAFSWTTPLGLIVRQPYRKGIETNVFTPVGFTRVKGSPLEPASPKQMSALAPNLIHSLDATHLAMTALEMQNLGLSMMAVHDSFWTYACDLPTLSRVLREQFLELYTNFDPLVEVKQQWEEMFFLDLRRHSVLLPDPPKRGTLDLKQVLKSEYFFS